MFYFVSMVECKMRYPCICNCASTDWTVMNYGWGKHLWDVSLADLAEFNQVRCLSDWRYLIPLTRNRSSSPTP